jgi:hypothetical protein
MSGQDFRCLYQMSDLEATPFRIFGEALHWKDRLYRDLINEIDIALNFFETLLVHLRNSVEDTTVLSLHFSLLGKLQCSV